MYKFESEITDPTKAECIISATAMAVVFYILSHLAVPHESKIQIKNDHVQTIQHCNVNAKALFADQARAGGDADALGGQKP